MRSEYEQKHTRFENAAENSIVRRSLACPIGDQKYLVFGNGMNGKSVIQYEDAEVQQDQFMADCTRYRNHNLMAKSE
jgi:hypothetical protein